MSDLTVGDQRPRVSYTADGATVAFAVPFPILAVEDLQVRVAGHETPPPFTVSGIGDSEGGTVTFSTPPATGARVDLWRAMPIARTGSFSQAGELRAAALNGEFARLTLMLQDLAARLEDTLSVPPASEDPSLALPGAAARAERLLYFDATGKPVPLIPPTMGGLTDFATLALDAENSAAAAAASAQAAADSAQATADSLVTVTPALVPVGTVIDFAGATPPARWYWCNGQNLDPAAEPALFAALGTTYGGDGVATFGLPDLRGRVVAGRDDMGGNAALRLTGGVGSVDGDLLGAGGGAETHTLSEAEMPEHRHPMIYGDGSTGSGYAGLVSDRGPVFSGFNTELAGGGQPHPNVQPTLILNKIVFAGA